MPLPPLVRLHAAEICRRNHRNAPAVAGITHEGNAEPSPQRPRPTRPQPSPSASQIDRDSDIAMFLQRWVRRHYVRQTPATNAIGVRYCPKCSPAPPRGATGPQSQEIQWEGIAACSRPLGGTLFDASDLPPLRAALRRREGRNPVCAARAHPPLPGCKSVKALGPRALAVNRLLFRRAASSNDR